MASSCMRAISAGLGAGFGAVLVAGGIRVLRDPLLRPPRLPHRRPKPWVLPLAGCAMASASLLAVRSSWPSRFTTPTLLGLAIPGGAGVVFEAVRLFNGFGWKRFGAWHGGGPDNVVVLGCALIDNAPSELLRRRLRAALEVAGPKTRCMVMSGGIGNDTGSTATISEAEAMAQWVRDRGGSQGGGTGLEGEPRGSSFRGAIVEEPVATNTSENIDFSLRELERACPNSSGIGLTVVVTSDFHVLRVRKLLREKGLDSWKAVGAYTPIRYWATSILREFLAQFILWAPKGSRRILRISTVTRRASN
ncbi:YdcF family protein [Corynebacterium lactis]|nr:YdcF family protein [Corynebacterium lactis]